jgi:hypothetical protein
MRALKLDNQTASQKYCSGAIFVGNEAKSFGVPLLKLASHPFDSCCSRYPPSGSLVKGKVEYQTLDFEAQNRRKCRPSSCSRSLVPRN